MISEQGKPVSNLMFDWLTVLQKKAEGVAAYETYLRDAEIAKAFECVKMFQRLLEQEAKLLKDVKDHVFTLIAKEHGGQ